jgi:hypothetical protein
MSLTLPEWGVHYTLSTDGSKWTAPGRPDLTGISREALVIGTYKPDATTTGVIDPTRTLVDVVGATTFSVNDARPPEYRRYMGKVTVSGLRIKFKNAKMQGPAVPNAQDPVVLVTSSAREIEFEDCEIAPVASNSGTNCINGHHFTLRRCNLHHGVDLVGVIPSTATMEAQVYVLASYLHHPTFYSPDPNQPSNFTHNDLIQWHGGRVLVCIGNTFYAFYAQDRGNPNDPEVVGPGPNFDHLSGNPYYPNQQGTSVIIFNTHVSVPEELTFDQNYADGGACALNMSSSPSSLLAAGSAVTNNKWGRDYRLGPDFAILAKSNQVFTLTGNTREDDGTPFNVRKNG